MPCRNGPIAYKRKHGVCFPKFGLLSSLLLALCCLQGLSGDGRPCSPCPGNCSCAAVGPQNFCVVNCSNVGLDQAPAAAELPTDTHSLDLSRNLIPGLDFSLFHHLSSLKELFLQNNRLLTLPHGVFHCGPLTVLDLSNNQITTIEERICENLFNLTTIDLSSNPFVCDCKLVRLVSWLQERGVAVKRPDSMLCDRPPEVKNQPLLNVSVPTCGLTYAGCLQDQEHAAGVELVIFSSSTPGPYSREECNSKCFHENQLYGGLGEQSECLCSTNSEPNHISESQCSAACSNPRVMKECHWTVAQDVFQVNFSASLPSQRVSVFSEALLSVSSSVLPVSLSWDFGDLSPRVNFSTPNTTARHKYALPGRYQTQVVLSAGHHEITAQGNVSVELPPRLELHCPEQIVADRSLEEAVSLVNWGGVDVSVDWRISKDGMEIIRAEPPCPPDALHQADSSRCFLLVSEEVSWSDARRNCSARSGELAVVHSQSVRDLLAPHITQERGVWLGLTDKYSPRVLSWVDGSGVRPGEEGLRDRGRTEPGNMCVSLDHSAQPSTHSCTAKRAFVCQFTSHVRVPDAGVYRVGTAVFNTHTHLMSPTTVYTVPNTPAKSVELMLFPALMFLNAGRLSAVELVTRSLTVETQLRLQLYRPQCQGSARPLLPGCGDLCAPFAFCPDPDEPLNTTCSPTAPVWCPVGQQLCPHIQRCLPLSSSCQPDVRENCSWLGTLPAGSRVPEYSLTAEVLVTLPAGPPSHVLVQEELEDLLVASGDFIALQHDAGPSGLLQCSSNPSSPWKQFVLVHNRSDWWDVNETVKVFGDGGWEEGLECQVRALYVGQNSTRLQGPSLSRGLALPGNYSLEVTSNDKDFPVIASCPIRVIPPLGPKIIFPATHNGAVYFLPNQTWVLIKICSQHNALIVRLGSNTTVHFSNSCPSNLVANVSECRHSEAKDNAMFAWVNLQLGDVVGQTTVVLLAQNGVTDSELQIQARVQEPLRGLVVQPHPVHRVLNETVVRYTASVEGGTDPSFRWTVDDKPYFTYYNSVLNIIYKNAAVYKLTVTAMNQVSMLTEHFDVTVDQMKPMSDFFVHGVPDIVRQGFPLNLSATVKIDAAVNVSFWWLFGDGGNRTRQFTTPYENSSFNQVVNRDDVEYIYTQPGEYILTFSATNRYESKTCKINVHVFSILTHVQIETDPQLLRAGKVAEFEAHPLPSPYGIIYTWNFGDNSSLQQGRERRVPHAYAHSGIYNICVNVNNTISWTDTCADVMVYEDIEGLMVTASPLTERNTPTVISANLGAGNNVTWSFDMGDGSQLTSAEPRVEYTYRKDGNYTVNITAQNPVSLQWTTIQVEVFVLQILALEPAGCIQENQEVLFQAFVLGNASGHQYVWSFGDGSPNETHYGAPVISHTYDKSGEYHLSLLMSSEANKANFYTRICVQPEIKAVSLLALRSHVQPGEKCKFKVEAFPEFNYTYMWDFGLPDSQSVIQGGKDIDFVYSSPGQYLVTVTVFNNISSNYTSVLIEVHQPIRFLQISHDGNKGNNLALGQDYTFNAISGTAKAVYSWDFGDGSQTTGENVSHAYNSSGRFNIILVGKNKVSETRNETLVSVLATIKGLSVNASIVNVPLNASVHFEALLESGDDVHFSWSVLSNTGVCDRCKFLPGTHTMFYTFRSVGTFNVIVTAENDIGTNQASISVFVQRELEGLRIVADDLDEECCFATNRVLPMQASLKEGTNMTFSWKIVKEHENHDLNLTGKNIELNFSNPGLCDVRLKASNLLGQLTVNRTITILEPVRELTLKTTPNPAAVNGVTDLTVHAAFGSDLHYRWWFDDDLLLENSPSVEYSFKNPGLKLIKVEVFNKVSSGIVSKLVTVQEPISGLAFTATNVTDQNFVASGINVSLFGETLMGSHISWMWLLPDGTKSNKRVASFVFPKPGVFTVALNATNDISQVGLVHEFTVQDRIQGLELKASKQIAAVREHVEFTISVSAGTSVNFILSISGDATVVLTNQTYVHQFTSVAKYYVNLTAYNQVSSERKTLHIEVMEPVTKLKILDCCDSAIPVGVTRSYVAYTPTRDPLSILWTFDLHHGPKVSLVGKSVMYTPAEPGDLTIYLSAFNSLNGLNVTKVVQVQNIFKSAVLFAEPIDTFINKIVTFKVGITPVSTPATCLWDFGDGTSGAVTNSLTLSHIYHSPGYYVVRVNVSNLVSWVTAQTAINISVLKCDEPEVQIIQAPRLSIWRYQQTSVEANVNLKGCNLYKVHYLWEILKSAHCQHDENSEPPPSKVLLPGDVRKPRLSVPKMAISAGNYTLVFSLSYEGVPLRKAACVQLSVMSNKLVPIIEGGTYRVWSKTQDLHLSGEPSYDPNLDPENQSLLSYHWECVTTSKGPAHCPTLNFGLNPSGPFLGISGSELEVDVEYSFRLTVSKDGMSPESTTQTVLVQNGRIPIVSLQCVSCKAQSRYEISHNSHVSMAGTCNNCHSSYRGQWKVMSLKNQTLVLDQNTTTTGSEGMKLVLRQGVLQNGESYIFSLHVTEDEMDHEGVAYIELRPNMPPDGGTCSLWADGKGSQVRTLKDKVHFNCSGYTDFDEMESPLVYSLLVVRCLGSYCEEFCIYKGTSPEHSAFLPPGFSSAQHKVSVSVTVEDHQGATIKPINQSMEVMLPPTPDGFISLPHYLSHLTNSSLREMLRQGDSQRVRELSLALITVLNEYEQGVSLRKEGVSKAERQYRVNIRGNITRALTSLDLTTVSDIQQTSAALAQCTAVSREYVCEECQNSTLDKLETMLEILQVDTRQGIVTPTEIADNILNIMGDLIHQVSQAASSPPPEAEDRDGDSQTLPPFLEEQQQQHHHPLRVAAKAYTLSSVLMRILMLARVLNEEPLILRGAEIAAVGKRADPQSLLCYGQSDAPECQRFSIPPEFNSSLKLQGANSEDGIVQLLFQVEPNPFPFNYVANYTISTEVASMEFRTVNGTQIPISDLDESQAITVRVNNGSMAGLHSEGMKPILPPAGAENISRCGSIIVRVSIKNANRQAGIYIQLNFTVPGEAQMEWESNPAITVYLHHTAWPDEHNSTDRKHISLNMTRGQDLDHKPYTFFLSPNSYDTTRDHFLNVSTGCATTYPERIRLEVSVFTSLCQYFSESAQQWQTDGIVPLAETSAGRAVCSTRHLTAFAASLFVPLDSVSFIIPERSVSRSLVAVLVCVVGLLCYAVAGAILRKLDQMDLRRASVVPLCGKDGLYKYEIQVKTGWSYGAGTTAHVGISLHGSEGRSGHRHLDCVGAFARNSLDIFHIATDASLGSVLKIRAWHDNKGLSPAWCLQYVLVKDLQTGSSFFFLVEEWLSVDNEKTDGRVEIEVEASEEAELWHWPRLLSWELQRAMCESHVWVSLWERPLRSPFTRLQRVTCCALILHLNMLANAVWYGAVSYTGSRTPVADLASVNVETVWAGLVSCLLVYPIYLLVFCLFRLSRSKVLVEQLPPQVDQDSLEIDDFLDNSLTGSSLLMLSGVPAETYSEETNIDLPTPSTKSLQRWSVPDCDWPDVSTDPSVEMGPVFPPRLKRGQGSRHLGVDITFSPDEDGTLCDGSHRNKYFSSSDEDLIKRILADGQLLSQTESDMGDLSSIFGDKTEVILLQKMNETFPIRREPLKTAFSSRTVVMDVCKPRRFPPLCGLAALWGSWAGLVVSSSLSMWLGRSFSEDVALMWLISSIISFLSSFLLLEPLKALLEALYFALLVRRLRPEEQDVLVDCPRVERVVQRIPRVRPPQGFALSQAREEARKVRLLHTMLKGFLLYTMFLLVVLLLNYSDSSKDGHRLRFQDQLKSHFLPQRHNISRHEGVWPWLSGSVVPRLLDPQVLMEQTGSVLIAPPRLRQVRQSENVSLWLGGAFVQWEEPLQNWSLSSEQRGSTGFIQDLGRNMQESRSMINQLEAQHWLNPLSRTLFLEFSLYNINTDLLAVFSFLLDFPVSERPHISLDLKTCSLHTLGRGLDLPLFLTLILLAFVLYFALREGVAAWKQGRGYFLRLWNLVSVLSLFLAISVVILQLRGVVLSTHHWGAFQQNPNAFSDFLPLARQRRVLTQLSASLLLLLVLKASHQLRFMREWGVFGRALRRSFRELLTLAAALLLFLLAYSHGGHLLFHSVMDGYESVSSICWKLLGSGGRGLLLWRSDSGSSQYSVYCFIFHISFILLRLVLLWLLISALLRNYRRARVELYRPVVDLQDYEMVELFLRRLKMWMGLSRAKEFRHKVRFEGMELPPSQASSTSDCKSLCVPPLDTPDAPPSPNSVDGESEVSWGPTSSSPCSLAEAPSLGLGLTSGSGVIVGGRTWKEKAETEAMLRRILPAFDNLLQQLDRVTQATEELYRAECCLEKMVRKSGGRDRAVHRNLNSAGQRRHRRGQKVIDKCPELAESPSRSEIRTPKSEFHKKERRSKKLERFLQITSGIPTKPQKRESSPEKTNCSLQNIPEKLAVLKAESGLNEESLKLEATLKASPTEKTKDPHRDLSPPKTKGSPSKVGPTIQSNPQMVGCSNKPISRTEPSPIQTPAPSTAPVSAVTTPIPIPRSHDWVPPTDNLPSTVFRHPAHTTTNPSRKRKHKPPPLKNKVHPNTDRPFSGHPKP